MGYQSQQYDKEDFSMVANIQVDTSEKIRYRFPRRPMLHMIVLFATDVRVTRYSIELQKCFLNNGLDVLLQLKTADDRKKQKTIFHKQFNFPKKKNSEILSSLGFCLNQSKTNQHISPQNTLKRKISRKSSPSRNQIISSSSVTATWRTKAAKRKRRGN